MSKVGREFYQANEAYASELDALEPALYAKYVDALVGVAGQGCILDVGCGTGTAVRMLRERGCDASGCDVSPAFIERAIAKAGPGFALIQADGALPYDGARFAAVGLLNVLEHVEAPGKFLDELARVLRPGGSLVLASPNMLSLSWPRPRQGIRNLWHIRWLNALLLASRAMHRERPGDAEFLVVDCYLDMAEYAPDYDAVCLTNYFDIRRALRRRGLQVTSFSASERAHHGTFGRALDALFSSPLGWPLGAVFVVVRKPKALEH
jgi:SAM-dependent methyltransferase